MIGYGNGDKIMQDAAIDDFKQQFNPAQFYRKVRKMGFPKEDAKKATRFYARTTYEAVCRYLILGMRLNDEKED